MPGLYWQGGVKHPSFKLVPTWGLFLSFPVVLTTIVMGLDPCFGANCLSRKRLRQQELNLGPDRGCKLWNSVKKRDFKLLKVFPVGQFVSP